MAKSKIFETFEHYKDLVDKYNEMFNVKNVSDECTKQINEALSKSGYRAVISTYPVILRLIYQDTHTVVKWSDGTTTVVNTRKGEEFNEEIGLAMAIAKKYFEYEGFNPHPRAEMLRTIKNADRYTKKENR